MGMRQEQMDWEEKESSEIPIQGSLSSLPSRYHQEKNLRIVEQFWLEKVSGCHMALTLSLQTGTSSKLDGKQVAEPLWSFCPSTYST